MSNDEFSDNERLKQQSQLLRGTIKEDLHNELTGGFLGDNFQLIRFHGMYQQDDRDIRQERAAQMLETAAYGDAAGAFTRRDHQPAAVAGD